MARPKKKKEVYSEFEDTQFPCRVQCVTQPIRNEIIEDGEYIAVDRYLFNDKWYLVILEERGREIYFSEEYFTMIEDS